MNNRTWTNASKHAFHGSTPDSTREFSGYAPWVTDSARADALSWRSPPSKKMTQTTCRRPRHYLLQRLVRLPRQRRHRQQVQTTAARTVWCVWSGNETVSHLSYAATLVSALLVSTESSVWAPAGRFVALISRWWWVSINEHCSYTRVLQFHALQMTCKLVRHFYVRRPSFSVNPLKPTS